MTPSRVAGGGNWRENDTIRRIPIILTGEPSSDTSLMLACTCMLSLSAIIAGMRGAET